MKFAGTWIVLLCFTILAENTRSDILPSCSIVIPAAVGCIFWFRSSFGVALAGVAMVLRWLLQPDAPPVEVWTVILCCTVKLAAEGRPTGAIPFTTRRASWTQWIGPIFVLSVSLFAHVAAEGTFAAVKSEVATRYAIALPLMAALIVVTRAADELGFRRMVRSSR